MMSAGTVDTSHTKIMDTLRRLEEEMTVQTKLIALCLHGQFKMAPRPRSPYIEKAILFYEGTASSNMHASCGINIEPEAHTCQEL